MKQWHDLSPKPLTLGYVPVQLGTLLFGLASPGTVIAGMKHILNLKTGVLTLSLLALAGCSSGGSDSGGGTPANRAPTANAGTAQTVDEFSTVTLSGSGSDVDGDTLTYAWDQTAGTSVTINSASMATATFDAPDVTAVNTPDVLTLRLTVSDGSLSTTSTVDTRTWKLN